MQPGSLSDRRLEAPVVMPEQQPRAAARLSRWNSRKTEEVHNPVPPYKHT